MEMSGDAGDCCDLLQVDEIYEFSAPRYFDFVSGETEDEIRKAQKWFEASHNYAPSPFISRIKKSRSVEKDSNCNLQEAEEFHQDEVTMEITGSNSLKDGLGAPEQNKPQSQMLGADHHEGFIKEADASSVAPGVNLHQQVDSNSLMKVESVTKATKVVAEDCATTPKGQIMSSRCGKAEKSRLGPKLMKQTPASQMKGTKSIGALRVVTSAAKNSATPDIRQENQAIKRQKLDSGRSRQILNVKERVLHHKSQVAIGEDKPSNPQMTKTCREKRYELTIRKETIPNPFVSAAELVKRFQSGTRELEISHNRSLSHDDTSAISQRKPALLTLTHPKEPEFQTSRRVRSVKVKSSSELEEEMLANIQKFKARPLNRKILEGPTLPPLPKSIPQSIQFQEFHLKTMDRASQHVESSSSSTKATQKEKPKTEHAAPHGLTIPKSPHLETSSRARPSNAKPSQELELEELAKIPKFKARTLNKKIFESKGELGILRNQKHQITIPQEFNFATDSRIPPMQSVFEFFDKLSITSESRDKQQTTRITIPDPFHLETEERGMEKEKRLAEEILHQQLEEQRARIPKASPYPYSTDYPVMPPKPQPKECTKPEGFQLLSLIRHEEEMQKIMEEREMAEKEAAQMRTFKAQPIMISDPLPVREKQRKPLTQMQEVVLHADQRALERAEFDKKVKEKEAMVKRYREEYEAMKMEEEEKATKQMRRMMVPHAKPLPNFTNPFVPERSSKELTTPKSPCLLVSQRKASRWIELGWISSCSKCGV